MTICDRTPRANALTQVEREKIFLGLADGGSATAISRSLGRHRGTVSREIKNNGGREQYSPFRAQNRADLASRRQRACWWQTKPDVWFVVVWLLLMQQWSPQQISCWLRKQHPDNQYWWVSHESIYQAIYVQTLPELRKELKAALRSNKIIRRPHSRSKRGSPIKNRVSVSERPADVEDRAIPGHWEGDLIIGKCGRSAVATLVERTTGFGMLIKIDSREAIHVGEQLASHMQALNEHLRLSLTWDQGIEMADHQAFTTQTGIAVFFCEPAKPWQRGTNENWNGLVRQYLPKGTDLSVYSQQQLNMIAAKLNNRPRARFDYEKPSDLYNQLVATST